MLQAEHLEGKVRELRQELGKVSSERESMERSMAADKDDLVKQGAALVDMGKQVLLPWDAMYAC